MGFALPARITAAAVRSYRTFSPLPDSSLPGGIIFCGTFRETRFKRVPPAVSRHAALWRPDFPLPLIVKMCRERLPVREARLHYATGCNVWPLQILPLAKDCILPIVRRRAS